MNNDRAAQKLLYQNHKDRLMSILYRYTRNIHTSQDIIQESFIIIFTKLSQFDTEKGSFENWSARIAINQFLQFKRKKNELVWKDEFENDLTSSESSIIEILSVSELKQSIDALADHHRVILNLYFFEEYSHKEISEILNIEVSSSRSRLTRAKKLIAQTWHQRNLTQTS